MRTIRLPGGEWFYDESAPLGSPGGFGQVFAGTDRTGRKLAVKRLKVEAGDAAHRELTIAADLAGRQLTHVMPVLDAGEDTESGSYFVVMPRADKNLQEDLDGGRICSEEEAADVMLAIAHGLLEVEHIVHRDLKPANILWHEGIWKVADFGIARFIEESTSVRTLRGCLTPPYVAPEQWQLERANAATDVYALGCVGYALLTGHPPFAGPGEADFKRQHLQESPPALVDASHRLRSLLSMMLMKPPEARPGLHRVCDLLEAVSQHPAVAPADKGFHELAEAGAHVAETLAREEAARQMQERGSCKKELG